MEAAGGRMIQQTIGFIGTGQMARRLRAAWFAAV